MTANSHSTFPTVRSEGGLLPPDLLTRIVAGDSDLGGMANQDYGLPQGERLGEIVSRAWARAKAYWAAFRAATEGLSVGETGVTETREQWILPLLRELGYGRLEYRAAAEEIEGRRYGISHRAVSGKTAVPVHVVSCLQDLDHARRDGNGDGVRLSPHAMMQEYLNRSDNLLGLVTNGLRLRLLRDNRSLTRMAFVEFDLEAMLEGGVYSDFALLYLTLHRSRLPQEGIEQGQCWLERWREKSESQGVRALGELRKGVEEAIALLGTGFLAHPSNDALRLNLRNGELTTGDYYTQLLRLVYRLIFLFVAEERDLLHPGNASLVSKQRYMESYSASRIRNLARRYRNDNRHEDLWRGLRVTFDILAGRRSGLDLSPLAGGLFGDESCPDLDGALLFNAPLAEAMTKLSYIRVGRLVRRVNYRDMDSEELGGVYEGLLERQPRVQAETATFELVGSGARKTTGSYYTPSALVQELVKSALEPVIADRLARAKTTWDKEHALLRITVCDPACGSGHFLLAAARRLADELARLKAGDVEPTPSQVRHALRDVIRNCIYGVDLNPLALDLCKLALWLEGHEPGLPLAFLDHRVKVGNSLVGATPEVLAEGLPDEAFDQVAGDDKVVAKSVKAGNRQSKKGGQLSFHMYSAPPSLDESAALTMLEIASLPDDTVGQVGIKAERYRDFVQETKLKRLRSDAWTAAFFWELKPEPFPRPPTDADLRSLQSDGLPNLSENQWVEVVRLARDLHFFHWHLEFPDVFAEHGFDCVLGNPPWERIKLQEEEFFAERDPSIAKAANKAARQRLIDALPTTDLALHLSFVAAKHAAECQSKFVRSSGRFPLTAVGDVNLFQLFAEQDRSLLGAHGRAGVVLPGGIATADTTKRFLQDMVREKSLVSLFGFTEIRDLFPETDSREPFGLMTMSGGAVPQGDFAFFLMNTDQLQDERRRFRLTPDDFELLNPNTKTCPVFRTRVDADVAKAIYHRVPVLANDHAGENPWGVRFLTMFHMANDSHLFKDAPGQGLLSLYEAKLFHQYNHRLGTYAGRVAGSEGTELPRSTPEQLRDPEYSVTPRYWVSADEVLNRIGSRVPDPLWEAYRHGDERLMAQALALWLAGYLRNHGQTQFGNDVLERVFHNEYVDARFIHGGAVESMEAEYPITDDDLMLIRNSDSVRSAVSALVNTRRPLWLLAFRDIARATDERTAIFTLLPRVGVGHKAPIMFVKPTDSSLVAALLGSLNSLVLDYMARQKVGGTSLGYFILKQLPILPPGAYESMDLEFIVPRVLELTYTARDLQPFAQSLGHTDKPYVWDEDRRAVLRAELDAYYAALYGLNRNELRYVLDPADVYGADFPGETFRVLKTNEIRRYGEYRTQRLVLEAWDRLGLEPRNREGRYPSQVGASSSLYVVAGQPQDHTLA